MFTNLLVAPIKLIVGNEWFKIADGSRMWKHGGQFQYVLCGVFGVNVIDAQLIERDFH